MIYKLFCTFAAEFQIYSVMTETKKAFKDWDVSDYRTPSEGDVEL